MIKKNVTKAKTRHNVPFRGQGLDHAYQRGVVVALGARQHERVADDGIRGPGQRVEHALEQRVPRGRERARGGGGRRRLRLGHFLFFNCFFFLWRLAEIQRVYSYFHGGFGYNMNRVSIGVVLYL